MKLKVAIALVSIAFLAGCKEDKAPVVVSPEDTTPSTPSDTGSTEMGDLPEETGMRYVNTPSGLLLRDKPSTDGKKLTLLPFGTSVEVLDDSGEIVEIGGKKGVWTKVLHKDRQAWVFGAFLSDEKPSAPEPSNQTISVTFKNAELGDVEHYYFTTLDGKELHFRRNNSKLKFLIESASGYQGWAPAPELLGKKFEITYTSKKEMNEYSGGEEEILIIETAKAVN